MATLPSNKCNECNIELCFQKSITWNVFDCFNKPVIYKIEGDCILICAMCELSIEIRNFNIKNKKK